MSPGSRVPSVREARAQLGVSAGTVVEAYRLLRQRGWIRSRPQSGYYVRETPVHHGAPPPLTRPKLRIHDVPADYCMRIHEHVGKQGLVGLGANTPDSQLLPVEALSRQLAKVHRDPDVEPFSYGPVQGMRELRTVIARRMMNAGCAVTPDEIIITSGATEATNFALRAVAQPGDVIAVESPTYHGFLDLIGGLGLRVLPIGTCTVDGISVTALERALCARRVAAVLLISSYTNPLGGVLDIDDRKRIVACAREHDIAVIEDDVYGDLSFDGSRPPAIKAFDTDGRVLYCSSFSKTLAPGLRIGWCVPGRHFEDVLHMKRRLNVCVPVGPQLGVARYVEGSGYDRHLRRLRRAYAEQVAQMAAQVIACFPEDTRVSQPRGSSVLWVEMPERYDAMRLFHDAEAVGIAITPGPLFDPDGNYTNCIRLNCSHPWSPEIAGAVARLGQLLLEQDTSSHGDQRRARRLAR